MLRFWAANDHRKLSDFVREWLDSDLELVADAEEDVEEDYIRLVFPEFKWVDSREKCIKTFYEFRARLADEFLHEPTELEWYILMRLYEQWTQRVEDITPAQDREQEDSGILDEIELNFDGDCDNVASMFELYKEGSPKLAQLGYQDLDRFIELMPSDILQEYLVLKAKALIALDGSSSYDPDQGDSIVSWEWDLDSDGEFDDDIGETVTTPLPASGILRACLCVTDEHGGVAMATLSDVLGEVAGVEPESQPDTGIEITEEMKAGKVDTWVWWVIGIIIPLLGGATALWYIRRNRLGQDRL
jgi:hypothetical protein